MAKKPNLSFWQIWNMSFGFLGIQFGFALQNANVSRIFETLGANVDDIPILWIAAPVTGLIIQPIIGHMSDNTWNSISYLFGTLPFHHVRYDDTVISEIINNVDWLAVI